jgi:cleavage and polyadenylation specificity factor subunit 1
VSDALQISNLMIKLIGGRDVPYSPSFVLDLAADVDEHIRNVVDFVFLPGFNNPTVAVLFQAQQTWTG